MAELRHYGDVVERVVTEGIAAAEADYDEPKDEARREGSVAGFNACRGRDPQQLTALLSDAQNESHARRLASWDEETSEALDAYWWARCYELEVEWVCNVISCLLMNDGLPVIVPPTARGAMKAANIVGVRGG